jgi:gliding motility-associated-like protein
MTTVLRNLFLALMVTLPFLVKGQCDVFIVPGSVQVSETEDAVMFTFDVTNNSSSDWMGDDVLMYWSLNSGANIMSIQYGDGSDFGHPPPLAPGQTETFSTPWMAIPNLPDWFPDEQPSNDNPWLESMDWPYYTLPFPFNGTWSPINLRLGSCGLGDGAWVYDDLGEAYYGPTGTSTCQDNNDDGFCDCDITVTGYDQDTHVVSVEVNSSYNCGCNPHTDNNFMDCYDSNTATPEENMYIDHLVFGLNVQTLDEDWLGCLNNSYHEGWVFGSLNFAVNPLESGDAISQEINIFNDCWDTMQDLAPNSLCLQMTVWQINFSQTAYVFDQYEGDPGWAATCGVCNYDTQEYPDIDVTDNLVVWCFDEDPPIPDIPGCMDPTANNYDPTANEDDGSCTYDVPGCTDPVACNYDFNATVFDDSCIYCGPDCVWENPNICEGCTDPEASNYSETAIYDDGSCEYYTDADPDLWNYQLECIDGEVYVDTDILVRNLGVDTIFTYCISIPEISYDECFDGYVQASYYIEPGAGQMIQIPPIPTDLDFIVVTVYDVNQEPTELLYNNVYQIDFTHNGDDLECYDLEIYDYAADVFCDEELGAYYIPSIMYQNTGVEPITEFCVNLDLYGTMYEEEVCWNGLIGPGEFATVTFPAISVSSIGMYLDIVSINGEPISAAPEVISGVTETWLQEANALCPLGPDGVVDSLSIVEGCDDFNSYWQPTLNLSNVGDTDITEFCIKFNVLGQYLDTLCFDEVIPAGSNISLEWPELIYSYGTISIHMLHVNGESDQPWNDFGDDSFIDNNMFVTIVGGPTVNCDVLGCTDPEANNFDSNANVDDGSCEYDIVELTYVDAECYVDCDLNGPFYYVITMWTNTGNVEITNFCAEWDVLGGQGDVQECYNGSLMPGDTTLLSFGPFNSNGSPVAWAYLQVINGVELVPQIENYETLYCWGDAQASCVYGCTDQDANNYDPTADVDDGSCTYDILGCTDPEANNFDPEANVDDGSCTYDVLGCTDASANNYNPLANVDDGSCQYDVFGCTDEDALNYNPFANIDDDSCLYYDPCSDGEVPVHVPNVFTPNGDGINEVWQIITNADCWISWDVKIFNRWGNMIYSMTSPDQVWDGTVEGKDRLVSDGVYVCRIIARGTNARVFETTTDITVFK